VDLISKSDDERGSEKPIQRQGIPVTNGTSEQQPRPKPEPEQCWAMATIQKGLIARRALRHENVPELWESTRVATHSPVEIADQKSGQAEYVMDFLNDRWVDPVLKHCFAKRKAHAFLRKTLWPPLEKVGRRSFSCGIATPICPY